jgi:hypothetical protein
MHILDRDKCNWLKEKIETVDPQSVDESWDNFFHNFCWVGINVPGHLQADDLGDLEVDLMSDLMELLLAMDMQVVMLPMAAKLTVVTCNQVVVMGLLLVELVQEVMQKDTRMHMYISFSKLL